jgi:hypothetical protein
MEGGERWHSGRHWPVDNRHRCAARTGCGPDQGRRVADLWVRGHSNGRLGLNRFENFKWFENVEISPKFDPSKFDLPELQKFEK